MRPKTLLLAVALLSALLVRAAEEKKAAKDEDKIVGAWTMVSGEKGGEKAPEKLVKSFKLTYASEGKLTVRSKDKDEEATFKLDTSKKPKQINISTNSKSLEGIYELDGDTLKLCIGEAGDRPTEFKSPEGTKTMLLMMRREKK